MERALRQEIRKRAENRCEYCHIRQEQEPLVFHVEHIISRQHGGRDVMDNLALACHHCNLHKGPNRSGLDPASGRMTRLFHPRLDDWAEHFVEDQGKITGWSPFGRTTVSLLRMNANGRARLREG